MDFQALDPTGCFSRSGAFLNVPLNTLTHVVIGDQTLENSRRAEHLMKVWVSSGQAHSSSTCTGATFSFFLIGVSWKHGWGGLWGVRGTLTAEGADLLSPQPNVSTSLNNTVELVFPSIMIPLHARVLPQVRASLEPHR